MATPNLQLRFPCDSVSHPNRMFQILILLPERSLLWCEIVDLYPKLIVSSIAILGVQQLRAIPEENHTSDRSNPEFLIE